jgi:hypothetical protein
VRVLVLAPVLRKQRVVKWERRLRCE